MSKFNYSTIILSTIQSNSDKQRSRIIDLIEFFHSNKELLVQDTHFYIHEIEFITVIRILKCNLLVFSS